MSGILVLEASGRTWTSAYRAANLLAREGFSPLWASRPFAGLGPAQPKTNFGRGAIVVTAADAAAAGGAAGLRARFGVEPVEVSALDGFDGLTIRPIRVAVYGGGGAPYNHAAAYGELGFLVEFVFPRDILAGALSDYDLIAVPGGGQRAMRGQLDPLGEAGCRAIAEFVRGGGLYLGCCAGAFDASLVGDSFLRACPQQRHLQMINAAVWNSGDEWLGLQSPGVGVVHAMIANEDHPVTLGLPDRITISHYNGPLYELRQDTVSGASDAVGLIEVVGSGSDFTPAERFLAGDAADPELLISRAVTAGAFNAVAGRFGKGRVVLFGSHPEFGLSLDLDAWGEPARMLANAAFWQASETSTGRSERSPHGSTARSAPVVDGLKAVDARLDQVVGIAEKLLARDTSGASWLSDAFAMATFGVRGADIWRRNLAGFRPTAARIRASLAELKTAADNATRLAEEADDSRAAALRAALAGLDQAIRLRTPPEWNIDFGYEGVLQQLDRAESMLSEADRSFDKSFPQDKNPYAYIAESPFQLAVGSYLSAAGVFANCRLLLRLQKSLLDNVMISGVPEKRVAALT